MNLKKVPKECLGINDIGGANAGSRPLMPADPFQDND
jgi:hypothetical protein